MIDKKLVRKRFQKSLNTYEDNCPAQIQMAENLIKMIAPAKKFDSILELGCGSGVLTKKIVSNLEYNTYDAVDIVGECSQYMNKISSDINFINSDIEEYSPNKKYNLIISNATLQWIEKLPEFLKKMYTYLEPNGMLLFTTFGTQNFKEIKQITGSGLNYYSLEELKIILEGYAPFSLKDEIIQIEFESPKDVLQHLKLTGVNSLSTTHWTKSNMTKFDNSYRNMFDKIILTYNPIYIAIINI